MIHGALVLAPGWLPTSVYGRLAATRPVGGGGMQPSHYHVAKGTRLLPRWSSRLRHTACPGVDPHKERQREFWCSQINP
jgi:hypothetical protein